MVDQFLPPVPNVVRWARWAWVYVSERQQPQHIALAAWAFPPLRFMPRLDSVTDTESQDRLEYWLSILMVSPCITVILCWLLLKIASLRQGNHVSGDAERGEHKLQRDYQVLETQHSGKAGPGEYEKMWGRLYSKFILWNLSYHLFCASLVFFAIANGLLLLTGGGLAWELWTCWQTSRMVWCVLQGMIRLWAGEPVDVSIMQIAKVVIMSTIPLTSEQFDTVKDWVLTGTCLLIELTWTGFLWGAVLVAGDCILVFMFIKRKYFPPLVGVQCLMLPLLLFCGVFQLLTPFLALLNELSGGANMEAGDKHSGSLFDVVWSVFGPVKYYYITVLTDGGCLFVLSVYVIICSHLRVYADDVAHRDLWRAYDVILALKVQQPRSHMDCSSRIRRMALDTLQDLTSDAREMIAYFEDWPQGFLGILLVVRIVGFSGYAAFSAGISLAKGVLIPVVRGSLVAWKMYSLDLELVGIAEHLARKWYDELGFTAKTNLSLPDLQEYENRLEWYLDSEYEMYSSVKEKASNGLKGEVLLKSALRMYLKVLKENNFTGFNASALKDAGFSATDLKNAGFIVKEMLNAGFTSTHLRQAGFSIRDFEKAEFTVTDLKGAGFTATDLKKATYNAADLKKAGFTAAQLQNASFTAADLNIAGFTATDLKDSFTASQLTDAGFTA